ncbi:MAG: transcription antitermination factor NusB [endosymbiont of Galathealinum brachiosum]|uniref:Transcription antitermination protein NusB n=1 Tax=endosymbiont of Galathealinum brachiosum TaxID=2200906 RepID=A0A370DHE5_9GAMM|nr:MAG: transcription antitermination factor NusB [endosymbiont of Galathealinum brachiosum]
MSVSLAKGRSNARKKATQALYQWQMSGNDLVDIEAQFHEEQNMEKVDTDYFHKLLHEVPTDVSALDKLIEKYSDRKESELDLIEQSILRLSSYELKNSIDVPYKVVISEAITLAKMFGSDKSHAFVNSILDKLAKELRVTETKK